MGKYGYEVVREMQTCRAHTQVVHTVYEQPRSNELLQVVPRFDNVPSKLPQSG